MNAFNLTTVQRLREHYGRAELHTEDEDPRIVIFPFKPTSAVTTAIVIHPTGGLVASDYGNIDRMDIQESITRPVNSEEDIYQTAHVLILMVQQHNQQIYEEGIKILETVTPNRDEARRIHLENFPDDWEDKMIKSTFTPCKIPSFDPFDL